MIPSELKSAKVTPIYKFGDKSDPNNYCTISVLPLISKIMECAIQFQLVAFLKKQRITGSIFIDLKKAFDLVDHHCLLHKLEHYEIRGNSLKWFEDYLIT